MKKLLFLPLILCLNLFGSQPAATAAAPMQSAWPKFNPVTSHTLMQSTAAQSAAVGAAAYEPAPDQKVAMEELVVSDPALEDEVYERELMRVLPGRPLTLQQKKDLTEFVNVSFDFENSDNYFAREATAPLEYLSIVACAKVVMRERALAVGCVPDLAAAEATECKRKGLLIKMSLVDQYHQHPLMQERYLFASNPFAITLSYAKPSWSLLLLDKALRYSGGFAIPSLAQVLLAHGANPNALNAHGTTPLIRVVARRHNLVSPADFDRKAAEEASIISGDPRLEGPQTLTVSGNAAIVHDLLRYGAQVNAANYRGVTALHAACAHGDQDMVETLMESEVPLNLNTVDADGYTPMMYASRNFPQRLERAEIILRLSEYAATRHITLLPSDKAVQASSTAYFKALESGAKPEELKAMVEKHGEMLNAYARSNAVHFKNKNAPTNVFHAVRNREVGGAKRFKFKAITKEQAALHAAKVADAEDKKTKLPVIHSPKQQG